MSGPIGLHGGGEFMAGDEPFLLALLEAARPAADGGPIQAVVVPTAAARHRPDATARQGRAAWALWAWTTERACWRRGRGRRPPPPGGSSARVTSSGSRCAASTAPARTAR